jgi:hypothetical protein
VKEGTAVVIANGLKQGETILDIVKGKPIGTLITRNGHTELAAPPDAMADDGKWMLQYHSMMFYLLSLFLMTTF